MNFDNLLAVLVWLWHAQNSNNPINEVYLICDSESILTGT